MSGEVSEAGSAVHQPTFAGAPKLLIGPRTGTCSDSTVIGKEYIGIAVECHIIESIFLRAGIDESASPALPAFPVE